MNTLNRGTICALAGAFTFVALAPTAALADSTQKNKNLWRNLAIGAGVIAGHGLLNHNSTEALIGVAGAAYSANRYEQDRKSQSQRNHARQEYYRSHYGTHVYRHSNRRYYTFDGHRYYYDYTTGQRVRID